MSDEQKPGRGPRLPPSGLADEVLSALDGAGDPAAGAGEQEPAGPTAADRIYTFTDSLQLGDEQEEEREVFETWVEFTLAGEPYGLPVASVQEVLRMVELTPVPHAPFPVLGVFNLRGRVVPLLDLRARLELPAAPPGDASRVLVLDARARSIGLLVDSVDRVFKLALSAVEAAPAEAGEAVRGSWQSGTGTLKLLDVEPLLTLPGQPAEPADD